MLTTAPVVSIQQIEKSYQTVKALRQISFNIPRGSIYGILGPNGSGKTTLLGILLQVLSADRGFFEWNLPQKGYSVRTSIGSLLETPNFYHYMSAYDNLLITAKIKGKGIDEIDHVLQQVGLLERKNYAFRTFSLGMKQRLAIAAALLGNPDVLMLDEPTNGLDPVGIADIRALILKLHQSGKTIILASHLLDEVEKVCTHVAILKKGQLIVDGHVSEVLQSASVIEIDSSHVHLLSHLQQLPYCTILSTEKPLQISLADGIATETLSESCYAAGIILTHLVARKKSLESAFIEITQA